MRRRLTSHSRGPLTGFGTMATMGEPLRTADDRITSIFLYTYAVLSPAGSSRAKVAELADALDLGSSGVSRGGSSPPFRTTRASYFFGE